MNPKFKNNKASRSLEAIIAGTDDEKVESGISEMVADSEDKENRNTIQLFRYESFSISFNYHFAFLFRTFLAYHKWVCNRQPPKKNYEKRNIVFFFLCL